MNLLDHSLSWNFSNIFLLIHFIFSFIFSSLWTLIFLQKLQSFSARSQKPVYLKASMQRVKAKVEVLIVSSLSSQNASVQKCIKQSHHHSSPYLIHIFLFPPPPKALPFPPPPLLFFPPRGGHDNAKRAWVECNNFFEDVAISRGGVSDSYPAFFLLIATTSNKNF